jgi:hypothetical protein
MALRLFALLVGRPGLDPGTLGLEVTFQWLRGVALVENSLSFEGDRLVDVGLVLWRCSKSKPKTWSVMRGAVTVLPSPGRKRGVLNSIGAGNHGRIAHTTKCIAAGFLPAGTEQYYSDLRPLPVSLLEHCKSRAPADVVQMIVQDF